MTLIISFQPGDKVSIGGHVYDVDPVRRCLSDADGKIHIIGDAGVSPLPGITVRVSQFSHLAGFMLAFTAPSQKPIIRIRGEIT